MDHNVYFYIHITYACVSDPFCCSIFNLKYLQTISASLSLTPLPALVPELVLGPLRGAPVVRPVADDDGVARALLDGSVGHLVQLAASQDRGRGGRAGRGGRISLLISFNIFSTYLLSNFNCLY